MEEGWEPIVKDEVKSLEKKYEIKTIVHEETFRSGECSHCGRGAEDVTPGQTVSIYVNPQCLFRVEKALPVDGIDYESFQVEQALVGQFLQYKKPRAAKDLFELVRLHDDLSEDDKRRANEYVGFDVCQKAIGITLQVTNKSDKAKPFAIKFRGIAVY